ncbi:hypothetical protein QAD02_012706 [Eretmocerus hayati]|uniref:Uncharacterized protein n=1 Tax=Eretmocerus hayati TaxID=131215 RepID=A0ACC2P0R4_9HYME|nr:hypothetical protein QAD02_012706 [Eretmocerus hayati]
MNGLSTDETPPEIQTLNRFEKVLIQSAEVFQAIVKPETVQKKNIPHYMKLDQVKDRTFHSPLSLEATLEKICRGTDPINMNHEMFILVRSDPTKRKVVWEDNVDITKVWTALELLKSSNPLYASIELPHSPAGLLQHLEQADLEYEGRKVDKQPDGVEDNSDLPRDSNHVEHLDKSANDDFIDYDDGGQINPEPNKCQPGANVDHNDVIADFSDTEREHEN